MQIIGSVADVRRAVLLLASMATLACACGSSNARIPTNAEPVTSVAAIASATTGPARSAPTAPLTSATTATIAPVTTAATTPTTNAPTAPVLGFEGWAPSTEGFGEVRPTDVFYGGDPTGHLRGITWTSWGGRTAEGDGTGVNVAHSVDGTVASAPLEPAHVVAWDIGICNGKPAYRKVSWYFAGAHWSVTDDSYDICSAG